MDIASFYGYLIRTRRDLWSCLESAPEHVLGRTVIPGTRFHSIKDLVFHVAEVEDGWLNMDIQGREAELERFPALAGLSGGPDFAEQPLATLLDYWRQVEGSSERYLKRLDEDELRRRVDVPELNEGPFAVEDLLWHVMQHEVRHSAQIVLLLRQQGVKPPSLDLLFYLGKQGL